MSDLPSAEEFTQRHGACYTTDRTGWCARHDSRTSATSALCHEMLDLAEQIEDYAVLVRADERAKVALLREGIEAWAAAEEAQWSEHGDVTAKHIAEELRVLLTLEEQEP